MSQKKTLRYIITGAIIAAIYISLTFAEGFELAAGFIQVRFAEGLCIMPAFSAAAVPGLFVGCLVSNIIIGADILDIIFGSLATLAAAVLARVIATRTSKWFKVAFMPLPAVLLNAFVVGALLVWVYRVPFAYPLAVLSVGAGQIIACYGLGLPLWFAINKTPLIQMLNDEHSGAQPK